MSDDKEQEIIDDLDDLISELMERLDSIVEELAMMVMTLQGKFPAE